ncbi:protein kinase [Pseudoalteromonas shioyasakiensis]|uniref:protein kinase n=1 Tax=Pseudoalteromonas shioyasakiensis TaxID=1190813 RepID=UPI001C3D20FD|nr:protein kinase [Pseudoalteromonas shioyasakiensis]
MNTLEELKAGSLQGCTRLQLVAELTEFPKEIYTLADTLEILDLSNNQLSELPDDFYKLKKLKRLFLSFNQFKHIPDVLRQCPNLIMVAFKGNQITEFKAHCLSTKIEWLILTDNQIPALPDTFGEYSKLKKIALAGNQLTHLPASMANCKELELIRLSANKLTKVEDWLLALPKLAWLAFSGNDLNRSTSLHCEQFSKIALNEIDIKKQIGQGASGVIHLANWHQRPVALKLFKGEITSDGYPLDELNCCLKASEHPNLIKALGYVEEKSQLGLVMELISKEFTNLGLPPSLATCTRDTFEDNCQYAPEMVLKIVKQMASTLAHLHQKQVSHGDIYAHNSMINSQGELLFGDFGAATDLSMLPPNQQRLLEGIEVRALGYFIDDLLTVVTEQNDITKMLADIAQECLVLNSDKRPRLSELVSRL